MVMCRKERQIAYLLKACATGPGRSLVSSKVDRIASSCVGQRKEGQAWIK
jgi:hypothetical protein